MKTVGIKPDFLTRRKFAPPKRNRPAKSLEKTDSVTLSSGVSTKESNGPAVLLGTAGVAAGMALGVAAGLATGVGAVALVGVGVLGILGGWAGMKGADALTGTERPSLTDKQQSERNERLINVAAEITDEMMFDPTSPIFMGD